MILLIVRFLCAVVIAFFVGLLVSKCKLPAILGWLLAGMILGPYAVGLIGHDVLNAEWYHVLMNILECTVGLMIGSELVWRKIKKSGAQVIVTTLTQSLGTFFLVSLVFGIVFYFLEIPLYLAAVFGGIALATAPAPALSIVREFKTDGPVTKTLIPMAALDDIVAVVVFFCVISAVSAQVLELKIPLYLIILVLLIPIVIGVSCGFLAGFLLKKTRTQRGILAFLSITLLLASCIGLYVNRQLLPLPVLNFTLVGMSFAATFSNMVTEERLAQIMQVYSPILGVAIIVVILNLGTPLDYHLILGAGVFTAVYILSRACGKYFGAYWGSRMTHAPKTVQKYLGLTLLPHSGVSLIFTGIAVSLLSGPAPESAQLIQGTIAAAAIINEVLAVLIAKKAFEWAGECKHK